MSSFDKDETSNKPLFTLSRAFNSIFKENSALVYNDLNTNDFSGIESDK